MTNPRNLLQESLAAIERLQARLDAAERQRKAPIAIVGAGCRYPGGIESPEGLWDVVSRGVDAVAEVPADRWDVDAYYDADPKAPGKMISRRGGFLKQVDKFDPQFFGISPREAETMDPQQRLLLECSVEAMESAGLAADKLAGSATGVFIGITTSDYGAIARAGGVAASDVYTATGNALNAAAGRISFLFGFQGPCVSMDTACSSSLVAVHQACQSLRTGESDLALAGGVNVVLAPDAMVLFSKWGMMAPDGACKTFDAAADGFVRAEGCAVIALKRLDDALAAGDPILAVIRGSAVNSDGRSSGLTVPNGPAQQAVIRKALASANLNPADIDYVEAHGTGTPLGDPIEIEALGAVMREGRAADRPLAIGSIKTNLGHTEAASGLAGLLKVVMSLRHEAIPPHLHFRTPNPGIPWESLPLTVPTKLTPWARGSRVRRGGVSSFGFSGTNAHVVLEEAPLPAPASATSGPFVVPLGGRDEAALRALAAAQADALAADPSLSVAEVATTLALGRAAQPRRAAVVATTREELAQDLRALSEGQGSAPQHALRVGERPKVAFLFTGQGAQYAGMGRGLYESEPVFRAAIERAAAVLAPVLDRPLTEVLFPAEGAETPIHETAYTQPALFALEVAVAELWKSWGVTPSIVLGHSVGEYAAACVAGVFSLEEGLALIAERGRLMQALPAGGAMAALFAGEARVAALIAGKEKRLAIAALNGPEETVVSGDADALEAVLARAAAEGIKGKALEVSHAFHSPRLDPMLDALEARAAKVAHSAPRVALVSNLTGAPFAAGTAPDAKYWRRHAREPVRFAASVAALKAAGATVVVEVGPHPTLLALASRAMPDAPWAGLASLRRGREDAREIRAAVAALWTRGAPIQWPALTTARGGRRVALPTYPFQRERYWVETPAHGKAAPVAGHPLLGPKRGFATAPGRFTWEREVSLATHPWIADHRVQGAAIVPATAYIEMALAAAGEVFGPGSLSVRDIENLKPIILFEGTVRLVQLELEKTSQTQARVSVHSRAAGDGKAGAPWTAHVTAQVSRTESADAPADGMRVVEALRAKGALLAGGDFYKALADKGNQWGPAFQGMSEAWRGEREAATRVSVPDSLRGETGAYRFHPAVADSCGHALVATVPLEASDAATGGAFVGGGVGEVRFHRSPVGDTLWVLARRKGTPGEQERVVLGDVFVYDEGGALVAETLDARLFYLDAEAEAHRDWLYEVRWAEKPLAGEATRGAPSGTWLVFGDRGGVGEALVKARSASGARTVLAARGEDAKKVLQSAGPVSAIVHLGSLDASDVQEGDPLDAALRAGPEGLLEVLHALVAVPAQPRPRLWLATRGAQAAVDGDAVDAPWNAALWGMGRALSAEHAELWGGLVDLDPAESVETQAARLAAEVERAGADDLIALRRGKRCVARLERRAAAGTASDFKARADATYLVTGGLGGIGLAMASWLVEKGARHLLLLGRTPMPPRERWKSLDPVSAEGRRAARVLALEVAGAKVETAAIDVAAEGALDRVLDARAARGEPPVRGIIHAAGVLQFQSLDTQEAQSLRNGLAAKVQGAWRLHRRFEKAPLDFFVMCSSTSSLLASPMLGGYAAGNAFLDALAHHRRARGLTALSVNWGTWGEVGMAVEAGRGGSMLTGMDTIPTVRGLAAMAELIAAGDAQAAVMPVDWAALAQAYPMFVADPFLASQVAGVRPAQGAEAPGRIAADLAAAPEGERPQVLAKYLRAEAARVLGFAPEKLDPRGALASFGFDSLMAVQLKNRIESDLGIVVPMIQFLQGPSVEELTETVLAGLASGGAGGEAPRQELAEAWEEGSL